MAKSNKGNRNPDTSGLKPFKPGQSGNPGGRPKKLPITDALRDLLEKPVPAKIDARKLTANHVLALQLIAQGAKGDLKAIAEIADRCEGKPMQRHEISGPHEGPIHFEIPGTRQEIERRIAELTQKTKGAGDDGKKRGSH